MAEGGGLLNRYTVNHRIVGSNPIPSAILGEFSSQINRIRISPLHDMPPDLSLLAGQLRMASDTDRRRSSTSSTRRPRQHGLEDIESSVTGKLSRGTFLATFFLASMKAIGRDFIPLSDF